MGPKQGNPKVKWSICLGLAGEQLGAKRVLSTVFAIGSLCTQQHGDVHRSRDPSLGVIVHWKPLVDKVRWGVMYQSLRGFALDPSLAFIKGDATAEEGPFAANGKALS